MEGFRRFAVEHMEQVLSSLGEGWLRVDALLLLLTQVSVLKDQEQIGFDKIVVSITT